MIPGASKNQLFAKYPATAASSSFDLNGEYGLLSHFQYVAQLGPRNPIPKVQKSAPQTPYDG
jgi:hypothetical protein